MSSVNTVVKKETAYIGMMILLMSVLMESVFLIIGHWDYKVLLGNFLGGGVAVLNFFLMGLTIQNAVEKEEKEAKNRVKLSQTLRMLMIIVVAIIGATVPSFNLWATLIPLLFPRIAVSFRPLFDKKTESKDGKEADK